MANFVELFQQSTFIHLCFGISYFTSGLIINILQCILFLCVKPFSKTIYRKILYYLCYSFHCQLVCVGEWWSGSKLIVYISKEDMKLSGTEHVLLVMNHTYEVDWLFGWMYCEKVGVLGNCKAFAKKAISYIPTIGWSWKFAEFVFLERSFDKDKEIIKNQLNEIFDYPSPIWLLLNAEGTRFTPTKHEASVKFAQERGMPVLKHHLIPRTKGFTASLPVLKAKCPAIMDVQLAFDKNDETKPTIINLLRGKSITGHLYLRRIAMTDIPEDEELASQWVQDLFVRKDKLQDSFHTHGDFFKGNDIERLEPIEIPRRKTDLFNWLFWISVTLLPILYFILNLILSGKILYFAIGSSILFVFYMLMQKVIGMSKISKASSYGSKAGGKKDE
ncbi:unnamed protein product [Diamesa serratosioi]